jgi:hypothetical protein
MKATASVAAWRHIVACDAIQNLCPNLQLFQLDFLQRWTPLLKQQSLITVYGLPTKGNRLPFSISICNIQREVCSFRFLLAAKKGKAPFSLCSIFYLYI